MFFHNKEKLQSGLAALYVVILIMSIALVTTGGISFTIQKQQKMIRNAVRSSQAYYHAETGIEDALVRIRNNMNLPDDYSFNFDDNNKTAVIISDTIGGAKTISVVGDNFDRIRKIDAVYKISSGEVSFFYGVQVGDGGMFLGNNAVVHGNVFSNGSVISLFGKGYIDDNIIVARNWNLIQGLIIGQDASTFSCIGCSISGNLIYNQGGIALDCNVDGDMSVQSEEIEAQDMPISEAQIDEWKQQITNSGIIYGDYSLGNNEHQSLGPVKIEGSLTLNNGSVLTLTGNLLVSGNLIINNGAQVKLDSGSYGLNSGIVIVEGKTNIKAGSILIGAGDSGSYLMILSTNSEKNNIFYPAIKINNNSDGAIFYASDGLVVIENNAKLREVTAYSVFLENNAEIVYESGLQNINFSSGTGASWKLESWKEVY